MKLKICGITNIEDVDLCSKYADALGFIVAYAQSPRSVSVEEARELMKAVPPFVTRVVVIPDFSLAEDICRELRPDTVQLHGKESIDEVASFRKKVDCMIIKACGVEDALDFGKHADAVLIDDKYSAFDPEKVRRVIEHCPKPVILAGGLAPSNILSVLGKVRPFGVDVASGVESAPGKKDGDKVRLFRKRIDLGATVGGIVEMKHYIPTFKLFDTLSISGLQIIAELKPSSPSEGKLRGVKDLQGLIGSMEQGGADAVSVLVEKEFFGGSVELLREVRALTCLPVLAKGFIFEPGHIDDVVQAGADAFLLMMRVTDAEGLDLRSLIEHGSSLGSDAVVEVASTEEMNAALFAGARILQVNNRDIYDDLDLDLQNASLGRGLPSNVRFISASGVGTSDDIRTIHIASEGRVDALLVGTSIMHSDDVEKKVRDLVRAAAEVAG